MKRVIRTVVGIVLGGVAGGLGVVLLINLVSYGDTWTNLTERTERELGPGAVCSDEDNHRITWCVYQGDEYRCVRSYDRIACAKRAAQ